MDLFLARQAILDQRLKTFGYELLFRSGFTDHYDGTEGSAATVQVITNTFLSMSTQSILGGRRGFINFPRQLLLDRSWQLLPPKSVVIEILENVQPDRQIVAACREMKAAGYSFALDDYFMRPELEVLLDMAEFVKIDLQMFGEAQLRATVAELSRRGPRLIAEKVETRAQYDLARSLGFRLFQGYFFAQPVMVAGRDVPGNKLTYVQILQELQRRDLRLDHLEQLVRCELSLAHKLLRYVNSAMFEWQVPIETVQQCFLALGEDQVRRWLLLTVIPGLAKDSPSELVLTSLVRARTCELLAGRTGSEPKAQDWFMMGLFSLLDSILNRPLAQLLEELNLPEDSRSALLGRSLDSDSAHVYSLVLACEAADWDGIATISRTLRITPGELGEVYAESIRWADGIFGQLP